MKTPRIDTLFDIKKATWVVAYRHAAKYFGRICELDFEQYGHRLVDAQTVRSAKHVALSPVFQLLTPSKQIPLTRDGRPATSKEDFHSMGFTTEPFVQLVDFCDYETPMHFEGADIQRFFSEMTEDDVKGYRSFIEGTIAGITAESPIALATPNETAAVIRGR